MEIVRLGTGPPQPQRSTTPPGGRRRRLLAPWLLPLLLLLHCLCCSWGLAAADVNDRPVTILQPGVRVDGTVTAKVS